MQSSVLINPTGDGSLTLYSNQYKSHYHSTNGAIMESRHVFIESGFRHGLASLISKDSWDILEYGLGTGLNAFLTLLDAESRDIRIRYLGLEAHPIATDLTARLNYAESERERKIFETIHACPWEKGLALNENFKIHKKKCDFKTYHCPESFDLIYFDAFGPPSQPELWNEEMMSKTYVNMRKDGILVTFCAKGSFKRALRSVGYEVEALPGPPGKREMTRAIKI